MEFRFRHRVNGLVVTHIDPEWAANRPNYEPVVGDYQRFEDLSKDELVALAAHRGLDRSGKKDDLIERLRQ